MKGSEEMELQKSELKRLIDRLKEKSWTAAEILDLILYIIS